MSIFKNILLYLTGAILLILNIPMFFLVLVMSYGIGYLLRKNKKYSPEKVLEMIDDVRIFIFIVFILFSVSAIDRFLHGSHRGSIIPNERKLLWN